MKNILTFFILLFAINVSAQNLNKKMVDQNRHIEVMINKCSREAITSFSEFFTDNTPLWSASPTKREVPLLRTAFPARVEAKCSKNLERSVNHGQRNDA